MAAGRRHCQRGAGDRHQQQRARGGDDRFAAIGPSLAQIKLRHGGKHKQHDWPPGHPPQRRNHRRIEHKLTSARNHRAQHAGPKQDTTDDLRHHQRRKPICAHHSPHGIRHHQNDRQRDQE